MKYTIARFLGFPHSKIITVDPPRVKCLVWRVPWNLPFIEWYDLDLEAFSEKNS